MIAGLVGLLVIGFGWLPWAPSTRSLTLLSDGVELGSQEWVYGEYRSPSGIPWKSRQRWAGRLPVPLRRLVYNPRYGAGGGRSYQALPEQNAAHLWLRPTRDGVPVDVSRNLYQFGVVDQYGWLYPCAGTGNLQSGYHPVAELSSLSFAAYPRWDPRPTLMVFERTARREVGRLVARPLAQSEPEGQWSTRPLPQTVVAHDAEFTLMPLRFQSAQRRYSAQTPVMEPVWEPIDLRVVEADGARDAWHVVARRYEDNWGNVATAPLPPFLEGRDGEAPRTQWRLSMEVVGDYRAASAPTEFLRFPVIWEPREGFADPTPLERELEGRRLIYSGLFWGGILTFSNEVFVGRETPLPGDYSERRSGGTRSGAEGDSYVATTVQTRYPTIFVAAENAVGELLSVRALDADLVTLGYLSPTGGGMSTEPLHHWVSKELDVMPWRADLLTNHATFHLEITLARRESIVFHFDQPVVSPEEL